MALPLLGVALAVCLSLLLASTFSMSWASADSHETDDTSSFGISSQSENLYMSDEVKPEAVADKSSDGVMTVEDVEAGASLQTASVRDVSQGVKEIEAEEEAARIRAIEQAKQDEADAMVRAAENRQTYLNTFGSLPVSDVDFSCGRDAFVAEWTERIDNYLAGSPLEGYGQVFATSAWDAGIDPRWSPAISNTESTNGRVCFKWHNAWGWDQSSWSSWDEAIRTHVAGLAAGYGFTISYSYAMKYCPPNYDEWYHNTLSQMELI